MHRRIIGCVVVALLFAGEAVPQPQRRSADELMREYRALIEAYHNGDSSAVTRMLRWDPADSALVVHILNSQAERAGRHPQWQYLAAAMLHTDVALEEAARGAGSQVSPNLEFAADIIARAGKAMEAFGVRWYEGVGRWLRVHERVPDSYRLIAAAPEPIRQQPPVAYELGVAAEFLALANLNLQPSGGGASRYLSDAEHALRRVVNVEAADYVAGLHLARVLLLHGRRSDAQAEARRIASAAPDGPTAYVALLLAGAVDERDGRLQAARESYQRAIDRYPRGQHAYIALAEVLTRSGDAVAAREVLQRRLSSLAASGEPVVEPWWYFAAVYAGDPDSLPALRAEARK